MQTTVKMHCSSCAALAARRAADSALQLTQDPDATYRTRLMLGPGSRSTGGCVPGSTGPIPGWYPYPGGPSVATLQCGTCRPAAVRFCVAVSLPSPYLIDTSHLHLLDLRRIIISSYSSRGQLLALRPPSTSPLRHTTLRFGPCEDEIGVRRRQGSSRAGGAVAQCEARMWLRSSCDAVDCFVFFSQGPSIRQLPDLHHLQLQRPE
jgi:hypothetical protein